MNITITQLTRTAPDDIVTTVYWTATLTVDGKTASTVGKQSFTRGNTSPKLVPFADLNEAAVMAWLTIDDGIESILQEELARSVVPDVVLGVPWSN